MSRFILAIVFVFSSLMATASAAQWSPYTDENGNLFLLRAPAVVVDTNGDVNQIYRPGSFIRVEFINGEWVAFPMNQRQWRQRDLTRGHDGVVHLSFEKVGPNGERRLIILMERDGVQYHLRFDAVGRTLSMSSENLDELNQAPMMRMESSGADSALLAPNDHEATTANFRVDESGAATIQSPIYTPEGIAGVTPSLAFTYSSRGGDGMMGIGWSLSAAGQISRCPQTIAQDGVATGVWFNERDRLCIDGMRLLASNPNDYWGSAYYFPEIDPTTKVRPFRVSGETRAFVAETKGGELRYYGDVTAVTTKFPIPNSVPFSDRTDALFLTHPSSTSAINNVPKAWAQKATADIMGNYIEYVYVNEPETGSHYLSKVRYTLRADDQEPFHEVTLHTERRNSSTGYQYGTPNTLSRRISSVTVSSYGHVVRKYRIDYREQTLSEVNLFVDGLQECAVMAGAETCKYPITLDWNRAEAAASDIIFICDPLMPHVCWREVQRENWEVFSSPTTIAGISLVEADEEIIADFSGDGYADFVYIENDYWRVKLGGVDKSRCTPAVGMTGHCYNDGRTGVYSGEISLGSTIGSESMEDALLIDFDGTGKRSLLVADSSSDDWWILGVKQTQSDANCELDFDSTFCQYSVVGESKQNIPLNLQAKGYGTNAQVADVNGDGFEDIVFTIGTHLYAYMNNGMNGDQHQGFSSQTLIGSLSLAEPSPPFHAPPTVSEPIKLAESVFFDMNGDGYTDLLMKVTYHECTEPLPTQPDRCSGAYFPITTYGLYTYNPVSELYEKTGSMINMENIRLGDLNGDGLTDLVFNQGDGWKYRLSNGRSFEPTEDMSVPDYAGARHLFRVVDLDGDGKSEVMAPEGNNAWGIYVVNPSPDLSDYYFVRRGEITRDNSRRYRFADVSGDGLPEVLSSDSNNQWRVHKNMLGTVGRNAISQFTVGHGVRTRIHYSTLSNPNVYERALSSQRDNGEFAMRTGYHVVATVEREVNVNDFALTRYRYGGLLLSRQGRGLLGFEFLTSEDLTTNIATQTQYSQEFPFIGMPIASETRDLNGNFRLAYSENVLSTITGGLAGSQYPHVSSSKEYSYAVQRNASGTITGSVRESAVHSAFNYDIYGNLNSSTITRSSFKGSGALETDRTVVSTQNTYDSTMGLLEVGNAGKRLGRLTNSTVSTSLTQNGSTTSMERSAEFTYQPNGLLSTETTNFSGSNESLTVTYGYDAAGNITSESRVGTQNGSALPTRSTTNTYDSSFNRVLARQNAEGLMTTFDYKLSHGHITKMTSEGMNSDKSHQYFDELGRQYRSSVSFGSGSEIIQENKIWTVCGSCNASNAAYKVSVTGEGKPAGWKYFDIFGREVRAESELLNGQISHTRTVYDNRGRVRYAYEPAIGSSSAYARYDYDRHGQVYQTRTPNGGYTTMTLSGLSTIETDALNSTTTSIRDYDGRVVEVIDNEGNSLRYAHHPSGQILSVTSHVVTGSGIEVIERVLNSYDADGRRTSMDDNDKGKWHYKYNAFGELYQQTDARGTVTSIEYDKLGREISQQREMTTGAWETVCHEYEPSSSNVANSRGRLIEIAQYNGNRNCTTSATPSYRERYTINSKGLVSRKVVLNHGTTAIFDYTYDSYLRPLLTRYPNKSGLSRLIVESVYANGHFKGYRNYSTGAMIEQVTQVNARGQGTRVAYQNGAETLYTYSSTTGWLSNVSVNFYSEAMRSIDYSYDLVGNLGVREQQFKDGTGTDTMESFIYDDLYRLIGYEQIIQRDLGGDIGDPCPPGTICIEPFGQSGGGDLERMPSGATYSTMSGGRISHTYTYDGYGNLLTKSDVGTSGISYAYLEGHPNRLETAGNYSFDYDSNGNITDDGVQDFIYGAIDKPIEVRRASNFRTLFKYGPKRELVYQRNIRPTGTETRWMFGGGYERFQKENGDIEHRFMVGGSVVTHTDHSSGTTSKTRHLHKDAQGSTIAITGEAVSGNVLKQQINYDPWGKQSTLWSHSSFVYGLNLGDMRGYTGHTVVDDLDLVHMGGRTYNPVLGRFMQADPFIQAGANLQNYNRYSYVLNNPLSYTDPSGYFFKKLNKMLGDFAPIVGMVIMMIPGGQSVGASMLAGFIGGGIATGNLQGAIVGMFGATMGANLNLLEVENTVKFLTSATTSGIGAAVQGGDFAHGFISASLGQLANTGDAGFDLVAGAIVGGTMSKVVGGKFANGALSSAFSQILSATKNAKFNTEEAAENSKATMSVEDATALLVDKGAIPERIVGENRIIDDTSQAAIRPSDMSEANSSMSDLKYVDSWEEAQALVESGQWHHVKGVYNNGKINVFMAATYSGSSRWLSGPASIGRASPVRLNANQNLIETIHHEVLHHLGQASHFNNGAEWHMRVKTELGDWIYDQ